MKENVEGNGKRGSMKISSGFLIFELCMELRFTEAIFYAAA